MPNRCSNTVSIQGSPAELDIIKGYLKKKRFFKSFYPRPTVLNKALPKDKLLADKETARRRGRYGAMDRWEWNVAKRGTKRDIHKNELQKDISDDEIMLYFDSAWSPPIPALKKLAELHDKLTINIQYSESGMCFSGEITRTNAVETFSAERNDSYFGEGIECSKCKCTYDGTDDQDRYDYEERICLDCNPEHNENN